MTMTDMNFEDALDMLIAVGITNLRNSNPKLKRAIELAIHYREFSPTNHFPRAIRNIGFLAGPSSTNREGRSMTPLIIYLTVGLAGCLVIGLIQETVLLFTKKWRRP
jgi:hypothetical protein